MATPFPNIWHLRTVAETSSKACYICYKPSTRVLITPDNKDYFYVCTSHLTDRGFASPIVDEKAEAEKKKKEAMDREIEKIKKEYEERMRNKKKKKDDKEKDKKKEEEDEAAKAEKERDEKIKSVQEGDQAQTAEDGPRIFALHKNFYQMRLDRIRNQEIAKRNQQRVQNPTYFPSVPKGGIT